MKDLLGDHISPCKHNQERNGAKTLVCFSGVAPCYSSDEKYSNDNITHRYLICLTINLLIKNMNYQPFGFNP